MAVGPKADTNAAMNSRRSRWLGQMRACETIPPAAGGDTLDRLLAEAFASGFDEGIEFAIWNVRELAGLRKQARDNLNREISET